MENQVSLSLDTYEKLVTSLRKIDLNDMADSLQRNIIAINKNDSIVRTETPTTDGSACSTLESSDDDSSRFVMFLFTKSFA